MAIVVSIVIIAALAAYFVFAYQPLARKGRAARAANGGRHTSSWWVSLALVIVGIVVLAIVNLH